MTTTPSPPSALLSTLFVLAALAVVVGWFLALASGAAWLETPLPGGLPLGNALSAVAQCAPALAAWGIARRGGLARRVAGLALGVNLLWLPVSVALAGNLALNFDNHRGEVWLWFTLASFAWAVLALATAVADRLLGAWHGRRR